MATRISVPSLANDGNRIRIEYPSGPSDVVRVRESVDGGVRVKYADGSEGILFDADYQRAGNDVTLTVLGPHED